MINTLTKAVIFTRGAAAGDLAGTLAILLPCAPRGKVLESPAVIDGDGAVVSPDVWRDETDDEVCARVAARDLPADALDPRIVDIADLPTDRTFRNAWRDHDRAAEPVSLGLVAVDMIAAREVQRDRIRAARAPKLEELDVAYIRADESGRASEKAAITARKQALRDATADPAIEAAKTPAALAMVWPAALND